MTPEFNSWWYDDAFDPTDNPYTFDMPAFWAWEGWVAATHTMKRQPLTDEQAMDVVYQKDWRADSMIHLVRAVERAHGIGGQDAA